MDIKKFQNEDNNPCWDGYEMVGYKKNEKGEDVPNCVPKNKVNEDNDKENKKLDKPFRLQDGDKKFGVYVKNDKGNTVLVKFGDPNMEIKRDDKEKRDQFRKRHKCDQQNDKTSAAYWSCKMWSDKGVDDMINEDVNTNHASTTNIAGLDEPQVQKYKDKFAGDKVFEVDTETYNKCINGKKPHARYKKYMSLNDYNEIGEDVKDYAKKNPKKSIIMKDKNTGAMSYVKGKIKKGKK